MSHVMCKTQLNSSSTQVYLKTIAARLKAMQWSACVDDKMKNNHQYSRTNIAYTKTVTQNNTARQRKKHTNANGSGTIFCAF